MPSKSGLVGPVALRAVPSAFLIDTGASQSLMGPYYLGAGYLSTVRGAVQCLPPVPRIVQLLLSLRFLRRDKPAEVSEPHLP